VKLAAKTIADANVSAVTDALRRIAKEVATAAQ
jgi:hypothetical protein